MNRVLARPSGGTDQPRGGEEPRDIGAWLDLLTRLLRVPEAERRAIRDELESHLHERVRDLMIEGQSEPEATARAIHELGQAAALADRFRAARNVNTRRRLMNLGLLGLAGGAMALSVAAISGGRGQAVSSAVYEAESFEVAANAEPVRVEIGPESTLADLFGQVADRLDRRLYLHPGLLEQWSEVVDDRDDDGWNEDEDEDEVEGLDDADEYGDGDDDEDADPMQEPLGLDLGELDFSTALRLINEAWIGEDDPEVAEGWIDFRVGAELLEIATREYFDRRETVLSRYDLSGIIAGYPGPGDTKQDRRMNDGTVQGTIGYSNRGPEYVADRVMGAIEELVAPELWADNGGDLAHARVVGATLFIKAPKRLSPRIEWVLSQLPTAEVEDPRSGQPARDAGGLLKIEPVIVTTDPTPAGGP